MVSSSVEQESGGRHDGVRTNSNRKFVLGFSVFLAVASVFTAYSLFSSSLLRLQVSFAEEQTAVFEKMKSEARTGDAMAAIGCLEYTINYYPSGTKQAKGSKLDQIVERGRRDAVQDIIAGLRAKTGKNHGENPQRWIEAFRAPEVVKK